MVALLDPVHVEREGDPGRNNHGMPNKAFRAAQMGAGIFGATARGQSNTFPWDFELMKAKFREICLCLLPTRIPMTVHERALEFDYFIVDWFLNSLFNWLSSYDQGQALFKGASCCFPSYATSSNKISPITWTENNIIMK